MECMGVKSETIHKGVYVLCFVDETDADEPAGAKSYCVKGKCSMIHDAVVSCPTEFESLFEFEFLDDDGDDVFDDMFLGGGVLGGV